MDRVLLKRLLGAGVVVALGVIVLPFILQGSGYQAHLSTEIPQRPQSLQPLDTSIPEPAADVREQLQPPHPLPIPVERKAVPAQPEVVVEQPKPREVRLPEPSLEIKPVPKMEPRPELKPKAEPRQEARPAPTKPESTASRTAPAAVPAVAADTAKTDPVPKPMPLGQWFIQLGSFSADTNAQTLRSQVQRAGVPCQIEPLSIEGRKVWRVRAGPFKTQAEADAALKRLQGGLKLGGMVMQVR